MGGLAQLAANFNLEQNDQQNQRGLILKYKLNKDLNFEIQIRICHVSLLNSCQRRRICDSFGQRIPIGVGDG